jgi:chromate reductase
MGASPGLFGSARAQYHLRQSFVFLDALVMNRPEVMIGQAQNKFEKGELVDEDTRKFIADFLTSLMLWTARVGPKK